MLVDGEKKSEHFHKKKKHTLIEGRGDGLFVATATLDQDPRGLHTSHQL